MHNRNDAARPVNEWQPPVKFILARGGPCWLLTKVCGRDSRQHNIISLLECRQLPKRSVVGELVWVISDWMRPLSTGALKALWGSHPAGQSGLLELIVYFSCWEREAEREVFIRSRQLTETQNVALTGNLWECLVPGFFFTFVARFKMSGGQACSNLALFSLLHKCLCRPELFLGEAVRQGHF